MQQEIVDPRGRPLRRSPRIHRPRYRDDVMRCGTHVIGCGGVVGLDGVPLAYKNVRSSANCLRAWQTDFGITPGGTPLASGTTPPAITITGSAARTPALRVEIQTTGGLGASTLRYGVENDGTTSSWIEQNVTTAATIALKNSAAGLTLNLPASTYTNNNVYQATASSWLDQATGGSAAQASASKQPRIVFINGRLGLKFDGADDTLNDTAFDFPAMGTSPRWIGGCCSIDTWVTAKALLGGASASTPQFGTGGTTPILRMYNGVVGPDNSGATVGTPFIVEMYFSNTINDYIRVGGTVQSGTATGNLNSNPGLYIGSVQNAAFAACTWYNLAIFDALPDTPNLSAFQNGLYGLYPLATR